MLIKYFWGFCMALADSVPGVSGGTIAFLLGFYDNFINSLDDLITGSKESKIKAIKYLFKIGIGWIIGMILSVSVLASIFDTGIYYISSLFLGFIISSIPVIVLEEKRNLKKYRNSLFIIPGILFVVLLSVIKANTGLDANTMSLGLAIYTIIAGMLAISAMVLPGISGSTLLLTFGLYIPIVTGIKKLLHFDFSSFLLLLLFGIGVILGVFISLRGIKKVLEKYRGQTIYTVIGMMIGSIYAIINGPTTLEVPKEMMNFKTFNIIYFIIGLLIVFVLQRFKSLPMYKKELKRN